MAVYVALGAFLMTLAGGWTAQRVTDRRHLVLGLAGGLMLGVVGLDLLPEALEAAGTDVFGVPAALLLFVAGFLMAHLVERLLAHRQAAHGAEEHDGRAPEVGLTAAAAMVGHSAMDGVAIGAAFQVGGGMGVAVALAVIAHDGILVIAQGVEARVVAPRLLHELELTPDVGVDAEEMHASRLPIVHQVEQRPAGGIR